MKQHRFGTTNRPIAAIGQGTWYIENAGVAAAVAALRRGLDLGMNHIDTAEMYGSGAAEEVVGKAIDGRRDEVFLVSKVLPQHASRSGTIKACEATLKRLGTDRLDCYLLHWRGRYPLGETLDAFARLKRDGKILSWGVSNFDVSDLEEVVALDGAGPPVCNQVLYHLKQRAIEHAVIPWCEAHGIAVVGYSPFGHASAFPAPGTVGGRLLSAIAKARQATPRQVALSFLVRRPALFTIPKAASLEHTADNAAAGKLELTADEIGQIDHAFALGAHRRHLPTL